MTTRAAAPLLALLLLAPAADAAIRKPAATPVGARSAAPLSSAAALLDSVSARYMTLRKFHFTGQMHASVVGGQLDGQKVDIPFEFAAVRPSKLRIEMRNPNLTSVIVSDGDSLLTSVPGLHQFTMQPAPAVLPGAASSDPYARTLDPLMSYAFRAPGMPALVASDAGPDTVMTASGALAARRLVLAIPPDSSDSPQKLLGRTLWIDPARALVLRDSMALAIDQPQLGRLTQFQDTRYVTLDIATGGPDSLYRVELPRGSARVSRIGAPGLEPPDPTGQPAADFKLETLDGKVVQLASLKGKVVVLDFWATWCGPCRRWLPIVAKAQRALAPKGVRIYAVNLRESTAQVKAYLAANQLTIPVLMDRAGATGAQYGASAIPLTVVIGRDGKIAKSLVGLHSEDDLRAALALAGVTW